MLPPFLPFALAFGGVLVPKVNLVLTLICRDYFADQAAKDPTIILIPVDVLAENPQCRIPEIQALVSTFQLYGSLIAGTLSALVSPKMGALSDRYGRCRTVAIAGLGMAVSEAITIVVATYPDRFSVNWILFGMFIEGLFGSFTATMAICNSYTADCTPPERRAVAFGYWHGALFSGIAFGPLIAGYIIKATGQLIIVFWIALICHLFFIFCLLFVMPESLSKARQMAAREKHRLKSLASGGQSRFSRERLNILEPLRILWPRGHGSSAVLRRNLALLAAIDTLMFGVAMGTISVIIIYTGFVFGWSTVETSVFVSIVNICRVTGLLVVLPSLTYFFITRRRTAETSTSRPGASNFDLAILRAAVAFDLLGYVGYATAKYGTWMIVAGAIASLGGMGSPTLQSALTKHIPVDQTGQLLGAIGLLHALARVVAPTVFNLIYRSTVATFPQTVFVCLAATFGVAFCLTWLVRPHGMYFPLFSDSFSELLEIDYADFVPVAYEDPGYQAVPASAEEHGEEEDA